MNKPINEEVTISVASGEEIEGVSAVYLAEDGTAFKYSERYKYFSLKQLFSIVDGRLRFDLKGVHEIISFVFGREIYGAQRTKKIAELREQRPKWYRQAEELLDYIKWEYRTDEFDKLMAILDSDYSNVFIKVGPIK